MSDDAPALADLMPWSSAPLRPGRGWVLAPDAASLTARWDTLVRARPERRRLAARVADGPRITADGLHRAGILPPPAETRGPASVLDRPEEGPNGQLALL